VSSNLAFDYFDILSDDDVRQGNSMLRFTFFLPLPLLSKNNFTNYKGYGICKCLGLKEYSNWPTYPQVYIRGELIGGLDIVKEMMEAGEFQELLS
jgi:glutaredoxin-related protein